MEVLINEIYGTDPILYSIVFSGRQETRKAIDGKLSPWVVHNFSFSVLQIRQRTLTSLPKVPLNCGLLLDSHRMHVYTQSRTTVGNAGAAECLIYSCALDHGSSTGQT